MTKDAAADWAATRGDKWRRQLVGLEAMLAPINRPLSEALDLDAPLRVADVGCGGGATTVAVFRQAPAGSVANGFDLSPALIDVARRRCADQDPSITFEIADMAHASPPDRPYDRLVSRFGVMFFSDAPSAFANLRRWLAPGGRFAFAVWASVDDNVWMKITRDVVAQVINLPALDPMAPGPFRYSDADLLLSILREAGFSELEVTDWRGALPVGGTLKAADAAQFALESFSSFAELLTAAAGDALMQAHSALASRFDAYEQQGVVMINARVHIVTGTAHS